MRNLIFTLLLSMISVGFLQAQDQSWNVSSDEFTALEGSITETTTVNGLTIYATSEKDVTIQENGKEINGMTFTYRMKLNGGGSIDAGEEYRAVGFDVPGDATISIVAISSSGSSSREMAVVAGTDTLEIITVAGDAVSWNDIEYTGDATTIKVFSMSSGLNLYYIQTVSAGPAEPVLTHSYTFEDGTAADVVGGVDGTVMGDMITIADGKATVTGSTGPTSGYIALDAAALALYTYDAITVEAYVETENVGNPSYTMMAYFGNNVGGNRCFWIQPTRNGNESRIETNNGSTTKTAMLAGVEIDDGKMHHVAAVLSSEALKYYLDGILVAEADLEGVDYISTLDTVVANIFKGPDAWGDRNYNASIETFNIYNGEVDAATIEANSKAYTGNTDARLASLSVTVGEMLPAFSPSTTSYVVSVPDGTTASSIAATPNIDGATVTGTGDVTIEGTKDTVTVTVTALDGVTTMDYTVIFSVLPACTFEPYYSHLENIIPDPECTDRALFGGWGNVSISYDDPYCGASSAYLDAPEAGCQAALDVPDVPWKPNTTYHVRAMVKTIGGSIGFLANATDPNFGFSMDTNGEWMLLDTMFTTGANPGSSFVSFNTCDFGSNCTATYIDNYEIYALPKLDLKHSYTFDADATDVVGDADATLDGAAEVVDGALVLSGGSATVDGSLIGVSSYTKVTVEAVIKQKAGLSGFTVVYGFGETNTDPGWGMGVDYFMFQPTRSDGATSRMSMSCNNYSEPWNGETGVDMVPGIYDDQLHHIVTTATDSEILLYVDGALIGSAELSGDNMISNISESFFKMGASPYTGDPMWQGSIMELNIYEGSMTAEEVAAKAASVLPKVSDDPYAIFDPAVVDESTLPEGMSIIEMDGKKMLQVVVNGWNSIVDVPEFTFEPGMRAYADFKYTIGQDTYTAAQINAAVQLIDTVNTMEVSWSDTPVSSTTGLIQSNPSGEFVKTHADAAATFKVVHQVQFFGQETSSWGAVAGDTLWVGKVRAYEYEENTIVDPMTIDPDMLNTGWEVVEIDGTSYFKVALDGWQSWTNIWPVDLPEGTTGFKAMTKYEEGTSGFTFDQVNTFMKFSDPSWTEIVAKGAGSSLTFTEFTADISADNVGMQPGVFQVAGQETVGWSAIAGDILYIGKVEAVMAVETAPITFQIDDTKYMAYDGFSIRGSWVTETGEFDSGWNGGVNHAQFTDDDGDHVWELTVNLVPDGGANVWKWGFLDLADNWLVTGSDPEFTVADATPQTITYVIGGTDVNELGSMLEIYPNPVENVLNIRGNVASVEIFNLSGMKVQVNQLSTSSVDVSTLSNGTYIIKATGAEGEVLINKFSKR